jgi:tyrosyl-tRNA synthetase
MTLLEELEARGLIHQQTNHEELSDRLRDDSISLYVGVDPTADSIHVGHLVAVLTLRRFQQHGHQPIVLIGGATGMIGDPSGRSEERQLITREELDHNIAGIREQLAGFIDFSDEEKGAQLVDNYEWTKDVSYIDWLRDVGKHFTINYMIAKESVRRRLEDRDQGISYTEFSYMLLQANDFYVLKRDHDCVLQIGGSDQWGNITAGVELIRRKGEGSAYGITFPLVTTSTGEKFGKSAGNAIWLDPERTSPYQFYQYFVRSEDADVGKYLRYFSFRSLEEIDEILERHEEEPWKREAQKALAEELTELVHGQEGLDKALRATDVLFGGEIDGMNDAELGEIFADVPAATLKLDDLKQGYDIVDLLADAELCASKGKARRALDQGGIYINNERAEGQDVVLTDEDLASETIMVLRKGKRNYRLARFE